VIPDCGSGGQATTDVLPDSIHVVAHGNVGHHTSGNRAHACSDDSDDGQALRLGHIEVMCCISRTKLSIRRVVGSFKLSPSNWLIGD